MSYVRSKTVHGNEYLYLVESVREGPRVRQRVLRYLGKRTPPAEPKTDDTPTPNADDFGRLPAARV